MTLKDVGDQWGHVGPNDQFIGLSHLLCRKEVHVGDYVLLVGIGIGMTWTAVVLRIEAVPPQMEGLAPPLLLPRRHSSRPVRRGDQSAAG